MDEVSVDVGGHSKQIMSNTKKKVLTVCLYILYSQLGSLFVAMGPTLLNLTYILDTDITSISFAIMANNIGFLLGSLMTGFVLLKYINQEIIIVSAMGFASLVFAAAPWYPDVYLFIGCMFLAGIAYSCVVTTSNSFLLLLWDKDSDKWIQALHFSFSIGACLCPLIEEPFLETMDGLKEGLCSNRSQSNKTSIILNTDNLMPVFNTAFPPPNSNVSQVFLNCLNSTTQTRHSAGDARYTYVILGGMALLTTIVYLTQAIVRRIPLQPYNTSHMTTSKEKHELEGRIGSKVRVALIFMLSLIFYCYLALEVIYTSLISTFVVKELGMGVDDGANMASLFWGCILIGRLLAIPLSHFLRPSRMLMISFFLMEAAIILMLFAVHKSPVIPWAVSVILGLGIASTFPTVLAFGNRYITMHGNIVSIMLTAAAGGAITMSPLVGYLLDKWSPMWLVYCCCIMISVMIATFIVFEITVNIYESRTRNGSVDITFEEEIKKT